MKILYRQISVGFLFQRSSSKKDERSCLVSIINTDEENPKWSDSCSDSLESITVFNFDKLLFNLQWKGGFIDQVILLNPLKAVCSADGCGGKVITLTNLNCLVEFQNHLATHEPSDTWAWDVYRRIDAIKNYHNQEGYSTEPFSLTHAVPLDILHRWQFTRPPINYVSHWVNILVQLEILKPDHIMFQELDALVEILLFYPHQRWQWDSWPSIKQYATKMGNTLTEGGYKLFRGTYSATKSSRLNMLKELVSSINHIAPGLSTLQRWRSPVKLESTVHIENVIALIMLYDTSDGVVHYKNDVAKRFKLISFNNCVNFIL